MRRSLAFVIIAAASRINSPNRGDIRMQSRLRGGDGGAVPACGLSGDRRYAVHSQFRIIVSRSVLPTNLFSSETAPHPKSRCTAMRVASADRCYNGSYFKHL